MKVQIENYRGWDIMFDTDSETFVSHSDYYDSENTKKSYAAAKKAIDEYIKANSSFKPFWIENGPDSRHNGPERKLVVGIRKDGRFVYQDGDSTQQIGEFSERYFILVDEANAPVWAEMKAIEESISELTKKYNEAKKKAKCVTLAEYKKQIANT